MNYHEDSVSYKLYALAENIRNGTLGINDTNSDAFGAFLILGEKVLLKYRYKKETDIFNDIIQDVAVKFIERAQLGKHKDVDNMEAYTRTMFRYAAIDDGDRQKKRVEKSDQLTHISPDSEPPPEIEIVSDLAEQKVIDDILRIFRDHPPKLIKNQVTGQRVLVNMIDVLVCVYFDEDQQQEIAQRIGCSAPTLSQHLKGTMEKLKHRLQELHDEYPEEMLVEFLRKALIDYQEQKETDTQIDQQKECCCSHSD